MKRKKGIALVVAIVAMVLLFSFVAGLIVISNSRAKEVSHTTGTNLAHQIAQAGIQKALQTVTYYINQQGWQLDDILSACSTCPLHTTDFARIRDDFLARLKNGEYNWYYSLTEPTPVDTASTPAAFGVNIPFADGAYHIIFEDNLDGDGIDEDGDGYIWDVDGDDDPDSLVDTDAYIFAYITATHRDEYVRQIRCGIVQAEWWVSEFAVFTGGSLRINGNPTIDGTAGNVRSNLDIIISGNPTISQNVLATGTITISGNPTIGGSIKQGVAPYPLPQIDWTDLYNKRDYLLTATGKIYDKAGVLLFDSAGGGDWNGLRFSSGIWQLSGNATPPTGNYYVETGISISGNPTWQASIFSKGNVDISGNPVITPNYFDTLIVSDYDIKISGNPGLFQLKGAIIAVEQIYVSGNAQILGMVASKDERDLSTLVEIKSEVSLTLSGNPYIKLDGPLYTGLKRTRSEILKIDEVILK